MKLSEDPVSGKPRWFWGKSQSCSKATPWPICWIRDKAGSDWIEYNIAAEFKEMSLFLNKDGFITALKEVPDTSMGMVQILGIDPIELAHAEGKGCFEGFDQ